MDEDYAYQLLLRDTLAIQLSVDAELAQTLPDEDLERVLGRAAREAVREALDEQDES